MFAFSQVEPNTAGQVDKLDVPLSKYLDAAFSQGYHDTMFDSVRRMEEFRLESGEDGGKLLNMDEANTLYSAPNLRFDKPIRENQAKLLQQRMQEQNYRSAVMEGTSFISGRGALGFATMLLANMSNPLDFAINLMPFVGEAKIAANIRHLRWLRGPLNRGLITVEQLEAARIPFPKFTQTVIDATVGQMLAEVPTSLAYRQDKLDYTIDNFLLNTAMGAAFGAGMHVSIAGAKRLWRSLKAPVKEKMVEKATSDFLNDRDIDVAPVARLSDEAIFEQVWREGNEKLRSMVTNNPEYRKFANELFAERGLMEPGFKNLTQSELFDAYLAFGDYDSYVKDLQLNFPKAKPLTEANFNTLRKANLSQRVPEPLRPLVEKAWKEGKGVVSLNFFDARKPRGIQVDDLNGTEFIPLVEKPGDRRLRAQRRAEFFSRPEIKELLEGKRRELVDGVAEKWRKDFDPQRRFDEIKNKENEQLKKDGKTLPQEEIASHTHEHPVVDEGVTAKIEKEANDLQKELGIEEKEKVPEDDEKTLFKKIDDGLSRVIKALDSDPAKLHIDPLLIEIVGKPVLKVMFQTIQKVYRGIRDLKLAIDEAMKYYHAAKAQADLKSLQEQQATALPEQKSTFEEAIKVAEKKVKETAIPEPSPEEKKPKGISRRGFLSTLSKAIAATQVPINPAKFLGKNADVIKVVDAVKPFGRRVSFILNASEEYGPMDAGMTANWVLGNRKELTVELDTMSALRGELENIAHEHLSATDYSTLDEATQMDLRRFFKSNGVDIKEIPTKKLAEIIRNMSSDITPVRQGEPRRLTAAEELVIKADYWSKHTSIHEYELIGELTNEDVSDIMHIGGMVDVGGKPAYELTAKELSEARRKDPSLMTEYAWRLNESALSKFKHVSSKPYKDFLDSILPSDFTLLKNFKEAAMTVLDGPIKSKLEKALDDAINKFKTQDAVSIRDMLHRSIIEELHRAKDAEFIARLEDAKPEALDIALTCIIGQL